MMKFLIILLDGNCPSYCIYEKSEMQERLMPIEILKRGIYYALIENLYVQVVYPDVELSKEYITVLDFVDKIGIASVRSENAIFSDVFIIENCENIRQLKYNPKGTYIIRTSKKSLFEQYALLSEFIDKVKRVNIVLTDIDIFTDYDYLKYKEFLREVSDSIVTTFQKNSTLTEVNILTDRIALNQMNNCNAGIESITLAPDGNFYICPAFYYDKKPVGNIYSGICIKNPQLLKIDNAPICSLCDAYQCKRCVWLNRKTTLEVNTPSHEQCVVSHIERNASRNLLLRLKESGFATNSKIKRISYLDPYESFFI